MHTAIRLHANGLCPHCNRELLGFASNHCSACGHPLEADWPQIPSFAEHLDAMAKGWTLDELLAWAAPLPEFFAWALPSNHFHLLNRYVSEELWSHWARLWVSRKGRHRQLAIDDTRVDSICVAALGDFRPWAVLHICGQRSAFLCDPDTGEAVTSVEPHPFKERWFIQYTHHPKKEGWPYCPECGGGLELRDTSCTYCGAPQRPRPGPWLVQCVQTLHREVEHLAPFEGGNLGAGFKLF